jgi:hypothetical protein
MIQTADKPDCEKTAWTLEIFLLHFTFNFILCYLNNIERISLGTKKTSLANLRG